MARPPTPPAKVAQALELVAAGERPEDAATMAGISHSVLKRALRAQPKTPPAATPQRLVPVPRKPRPPAAAIPDLEPPAPKRHVPGDAPPPIDAEADPLVVARSLLARTSHDIANLQPDSPRLNPARAELRAIVKMIEAFERTRAAVETPEEAEARRRREDGETRRLILETVEKAEARAAERGVCVHCGAALGGGKGGEAA